MIKYYCDKCGKELTREDVIEVGLIGRLLYSSKITSAHVNGHLCVECSEIYKKEINQIIGSFHTFLSKEKFIENA